MLCFVLINSVISDLLGRCLDLPKHSCLLVSFLLIWWILNLLQRRFFRSGLIMTKSSNARAVSTVWLMTTIPTSCGRSDVLSA